MCENFITVSVTNTIDKFHSGALDSLFIVNCLFRMMQMHDQLLFFGSLSVLYFAIVFDCKTPN